MKDLGTYTFLTSKETEAQRDEVAYLRKFYWLVEKQELEPRPPDSWSRRPFTLEVKVLNSQC